MANPAFRSLIEGFNAQIKSMNENDLKVYDEDNREYFISEIKYDQKEDKIFFQTKEDPEEFKRMTAGVN